MGGQRAVGGQGAQRALFAALLALSSLGCGGSQRSAPLATLEVDRADPLAVFEASRPTCVTSEAITPDASTRAQVQVIVENIRAVGELPPETPAEPLSAELDRNYRALLTLGPSGRAAVAEAVQAELRAGAPNDFLLLDLGHFLMSDDCAELAVSRAALERLDPADPIVRMGNADLFEFTHAMAFRYGRALLPVVDRVAAAADRSVFYPQHALELTPMAQAVFLWGVTDPRVDEHLSELIEREGPARARAAQALGVLSTPSSADALGSLLRPGVTPELFESVSLGLINGAGDQGQRVLLALEPARFGAELGPQIERIQGMVSQLSYESLRGHLGDAQRMDSARLRERLGLAIMNSGVDDELAPETVLDAELTRAELIDWLRALRAAQLRRLSDEGIADAKISSALISVVAYRDH